jgi:hypothetical protein
LIPRGGEQKYLKELLLKSPGSNVPYIVSLTDYLNSPVPVVNSSLELLFDWNSKKKKKKKNPSQTRESNDEPI